jgi:hypothetical protein
MHYAFMPGAEDYIARLRSEGVKTALVTSSNDKKMRNVRRQIPQFDSLFDLVLTSEDFTRSKPFPDCYLQAAHLYNCIGFFEQGRKALDALSLLDMTFDQMESVEEIHRIFCAEMVLAAHANKDEREALVDKAVKKDLRYMRYILDQKQYKKYLLLLNTTLQNRGLK